MSQSCGDGAHGPSSPEPMSLLDRAIYIAAGAHNGQIDKGGCWLWTGGLRGNGKVIRPACWAPDEKRVETAYRVAYRAFNGPIPEGLYVLHKCDVPMCVNPDHLFLGTHLDNMADMAAKGRGSWQRYPERWIERGAWLGVNHRAHGTAFKTAKINDEDVRAIRASTETVAVLATRYPICTTIIRHIRARRRWAHVAD